MDYLKKVQGKDLMIKKEQVVGLEDSDWIAPTLINSWANYSGSNESGYRRKDGIVYLKGLVLNPTTYASDKRPIFTLPDGFRPTQEKYFIVVKSLTDFHPIIVQTNGVVRPYQYTTNQYLSLDGISFLTD